MKKIGRSDIIGEQGVAFVRGVILNMGFMFYETGGVEAGIDGMIEVRDEVTGEVKNLILQVQVKSTTRSWPAETDTSFEFNCSEDDIKYWREGTAPVILVVTRPQDQVAYWKSIKDWFSDPDTLKSKKIRFDKVADLFSRDAGQSLIELASQTIAGAIAPAVRLHEELYSNLLAVQFAETIYWAPTDHNSNKDFGAALRSAGNNPPGEWVVKSKSVISFHDLDTEPFKRVCDTGALEQFDAEEWSQSDDEEKLRDFVQLLNRSLSEFLYPDVRFDKEYGLHFFMKPRAKHELKYAYKSLTNWTSRKVVRRYGRKKAAQETAFFRHLAFWGRFVRYDKRWYLEVNPSYRFTTDGQKTSPYSADYLKGIKERENNDSVLGQFLTWRFFLTHRGGDDLLTAKYPFLSFSELKPLEIPFGVPDELWRDREVIVPSSLLDWETEDE